MIPFILRLKKDGEVALLADSGADVSGWLPGVHTVECSLPISSLENGEYSLEVAITADDTPEIYLATTAEKNGRYYKIGSFSKI